MHSELGRFTGKGPTADERKRGIEFHRRAGDHAGKHGMSFALEAVNRFECYSRQHDGRPQLRPAIWMKSAIRPSKAMYDTFHANIEETDPVGAINAGTAATSIHVHISENDRGAPGQRPCRRGVRDL